MNLQEILTEKISKWEEGLIATLFLNGLCVNDLSLEESSKERITMFLGVLGTLPWSYAKEICYEISRKEKC
jgi:hypothetical protein